MIAERLTYLAAVNQTLEQVLEIYPESFILGEDVGAYGGAFGATAGLQERFPDRVLETPISEAAITGLATGAALMGKRPILEIQFGDFLTVAMDQIVNQLAKIPYITRQDLPVVIRVATGAGTGAGVQHSQSLEAWFAHVPGLQVLSPSNAYDAKGLLLGAVASGKPTLIFEPKTCYKETSLVPKETYQLPLGRSQIVAEGTDVTVVAVGSMVPLVEQAIRQISFSVNLLDLRSIAPLDRAGIFQAASKTGRVLVVTESYGAFGLAAEVMAGLVEQGFSGKMKRLTSEFTPIPAAQSLESKTLPSVDDIVREIEGMMHENQNEK